MNCKGHHNKEISLRNKHFQLSLKTIYTGLSVCFLNRLFLILLVLTLTRTGAIAQMFSDVPAEHWAYDYIYTLKQYDYIKGKGNNQYAPDDVLSRAEVAVFIIRGIHGSNYLPPTPTNQVFDDVPLTEWYAKWVNALWEEGYTKGCDDDGKLYCPEQSVSRSEVCVFFLRMKNGVDYIPPAPGKRIFSDVPRGEWFEKWVNEAYLEGLIPPFMTSPKVLFNPNGDVTRAMAAYIMVRAKRLYLLVDQNKNRDVTKLPVGSDIKNNLSWYPQVQIDLATQIEEYSPESQYYVYEPEVGNYSDRGAFGYNLCGQVCLSMILETVTREKYKLKWIWEKGTDKTKEGTDIFDLAKAVCKSFTSYTPRIVFQWDVITYWNRHVHWNYDYNGVYQQWEERPQPWWETPNGKDTFADSLYKKLSNNHYLIVGVQMKRHTHPSYDPYGALTPYSLQETNDGTQVGHWVVVTGLTKHWDFQQESICPLNWVRINNPFANRVEYYSWRDFDKSVNGHSMVEISVKEIWIQATSIDISDEKYEGYELKPNYPNPFNPSTIINYSLPKAGHVKISVYDVLGRKIKDLVDAEMAAGNHQVEFINQNYPSGVYVYTMESGGFKEVRKMSILK